MRAVHRSSSPPIPHSERYDLRVLVVLLTCLVTLSMAASIRIRRQDEAADDIYKCMESTPGYAFTNFEAIKILCAEQARK